MSSKIKVQRICEYCGNEFIAQTTKTRFCSNRCNKANNRKNKREQLIASSNDEVKKTREIAISTNSINLNNKDVFNISESASYLGVSRQTIYNWLNSGMIKGKRMSPRKVLILKSDLFSLFDNNQAYEKPLPVKAESPKGKVQHSSLEQQIVTEFYTNKEVIKKYGISEAWLYRLIKNEKFSRKRIGGMNHISKKQVDEYFRKKERAIENINEWYTVPELQEKYNLSRNQIYGRVSEHKIPKKKEGKFVKISKKHFDELFL